MRGKVFFILVPPNQPLRTAGRGRTSEQDVTAGSPKQNHPTARRCLQVGLFVTGERASVSGILPLAFWPKNGLPNRHCAVSAVFLICFFLFIHCNPFKQLLFSKMLVLEERASCPTANDFSSGSPDLGLLRSSHLHLLFRSYCLDLSSWSVLNCASPSSFVVALRYCARLQ